jgi:soluble lytic murein transglycosylase
MHAFARRLRTLAGFVAGCAACALVAPAIEPGVRAQSPAPAQDQDVLQPTRHAAVPQALEEFWLVPSARERASLAREAVPLSAAAKAYAAGNYAAALAAAQQAPQEGALGAYAAFYAALSHLRLSHGPEAERGFDAVLNRKPDGYLAVGALLGKGEAAEVRGDSAGAADSYERLGSLKTPSPEDALLRLGRAALAAGDRRRAAAAFLRVYYEFPLTDAATSAADALGPLQDQIVRANYKADLGRALILFGAKRYADARSAFQDLQKQASGDDREVADLRVAESDYFLKRYAAARDVLQPYLERASRRAEARFFYSSAIRELGDEAQYVSLVRRLVDDFPDSTWAEEALNNLGTYFILTNQDERAAEAFREAYEKFSRGQHAERSAWKYGWWSYRTGAYAETVRVFEAAAAAFPRSDYRPSFLYWAARAHGKLGERDTAESRMRLVYGDYRNSYYGRLAGKQLSLQHAALSATADVVPASIRVQDPAPADLPPTAPLIRKLLAAGLYDDALNELRYAQRAWGTSPVIEATIAWVYHEKGDLRRAITIMRRAYPQHMAAGGEGLPNEILQVIFPLTYWTSIKRYASTHDLDPYLIAALIAQESTFDPDAHSSANAWGLMQLVPSTGRRLAASVGIRRFNTRLLTNAELNIRLGTLYFSRLVEQFGGTYYALASYNAGESRVVRWKADRPSLDEDEFIDDIPFPETQNYVKRILGTAEDYRRLYGEAGGQATPVIKASTGTSGPAQKAQPAKKTTVKKKAPAKKKKAVGPTPRHKASTARPKRAS